MKIHENHEIHENQRKSPKIYENPRKSMKIYENPRKSTKINENQFKSIEINNLIKSINQIIKTYEKRVGGRGEACKCIGHMFVCFGNNVAILFGIFVGTLFSIFW